MTENRRPIVTGKDDYTDVMAACVIMFAVLAIANGIKTCVNENKMSAAQTKQIEQQVQNYRATLPNYADSISAFEKIHGPKVITWTDAMTGCKQQNARDSLANNIAVIENKRTDLFNKWRNVESQVAAYRSKLYQEQQRQK